jgi:UDP-glucose 4-epimerase
MNIAVTGGNGRLGRVVVRQLIERGHAVVVIDRASSEIEFPDVPIIGVDMTDFAAVVKAFEVCDAVVHLAAIPNPRDFPAHEVYANNTVTSFNALQAAAELGIRRVCLASSINAIGGAYSRKARYDYFPVDERHPTYSEDAYSLSKWVMEEQAGAFARRHPDMTIACLRFHGLAPAKYDGTPWLAAPPMVNHLWAYTNIEEGARACEASLLANYTGHEAFFITAPTTVINLPSAELAQRFYPDVPIRGNLSGRRSFYDASKAERLLGWQHNEEF